MKGLLVCGVTMDSTKGLLYFDSRFFVSHSGAASVRCASSCLASLGNSNSNRKKQLLVCPPVFCVNEPPPPGNIVSSKTDDDHFHTLLDFESLFHNDDDPGRIERKNKIRSEMSDWRKSLKKAWESYKRSSSGDPTHWHCSLILWLREINDEVRQYNEYLATPFASHHWMMSGLRWEKELGRLDEQICHFHNFSRKDRLLLLWLLEPVTLDNPFAKCRQDFLLLFSKSAIPSEWYDFGIQLDIKESKWKRSLVKAWQSKCSGGDHSKWLETSQALKLQLQEINNMVLEHNLFVPSDWQRVIDLKSWEQELAKAQKHPNYADHQVQRRVQFETEPDVEYFEWRRSLVKAWVSKCSGDHSKWVESSEALKLQLQVLKYRHLHLPFFDWKICGPDWDYELSFAQYQCLENMERERLKFSEDASLHREKISLDLNEEINSNICKWRISLRKAFASKCEDDDSSKWFINSLALQFQLEEINTKVFMYNLLVPSDRKMFVRYDRKMCGLDWEEELEKEIKNIII